MVWRAYFKALFNKLLNTFVIASLSMAAIILSWGICCNNSFCFCRIVGSKRVIVSFSNAVTSTVSNFNSNLLAPIFWKSSSWPVRSNNLLVFCPITFKFLFNFWSLISISSMASNGPLINVKGVRTSWAISVKKLTFDS